MDSNDFIVAGIDDRSLWHQDTDQILALLGKHDRDVIAKSRELRIE
jgi:hypothetical protein